MAYNIRIRIAPGTMGLAGLAVDLFGVNRVDPGSWTTPVWVENLSEEEALFAEELFPEYGLTVTREKG